MDDLSGLEWTSASSNTQNPPATKPAPSYASLRPSPTPPLAGRITPLSAQSSGSFVATNRLTKPPSKTPTPANDSFSGLLSLGSSKPANSLSLQERQKQLLEGKVRQEAAQRNGNPPQFAAQDSQFWDALGNGNAVSQPAFSTGSRAASASNGIKGLSEPDNKQTAAVTLQESRLPYSSTDENDLLAAFSSSAPVDASSHFPAPQGLSSGRSTPGQPVSNGHQQTAGPGDAHGGAFGDDDDDPFGLGQLSQRPIPTRQPPPTNDDDNILGMLGRPASEAPPKAAQRRSPNPPDGADEEQPPLDPRDRAVAELVDMGFPADKSAEALSRTDSGIDVQAAVGWLLNQAHQESKQKAERGATPSSTTQESDHRPERRTREDRAGGAMPAWMRDQAERSRSGQRRQDSRSPAVEKDVTQLASEIGSNLFKSANTLWKTGQKKVQKAVAEFQQDADASQPKWMRETRTQESVVVTSGPTGTSIRTQRQPIAESTSHRPNLTDEALMLESGGSRPQKPSSQPSSKSRPPASSVTNRGDTSPAVTGALLERPSSKQPRFLQTQTQTQTQTQDPQRNPLGRLTKQDVEEQSSQAYVSPARRKRPAPKPSEPEPDLFSSPQPPPNAAKPPLAPPPLQPNNPSAQNPPSSKPQPPRSTPTPTRPKPPPRQIPPVSATSLAASTSHRQRGTEAFKRGDYAAAHTSYTAALAPLPQTHPTAIPLLCNRALTSLKIGDPRAAVADADAALSAIGPSRGEGETIMFAGGEGEKDMREFFSRALMRKAEALEAMEKWGDAAAVWREAVEAGVGGAVSIQGRDRCEKAAGGGGSSAQQQTRPTAAKTTGSQRPPQAKKPPARPTAGVGSPTVSAAASAAAVQKLRAANAAADRADDEKFALTDAVDAKLAAWKGSKADNLRALLGSLDAVLWPEAGWTKVGMSDLVMPGRVKVVYMRAIGKVHPDKIPQNATTEQRMISAAVFSTLNEAWDKFKKDNGM